MKAKNKDLVILIRRLCHALPSNHPVRLAALDYLKRTGNNPSPLKHGEMLIDLGNSHVRKKTVLCFEGEEHELTT